jgi:hypothetical protein
MGMHTGNILAATWKTTTEIGGFIVDLKEICFGNVDWVELSLERVQ